MDFYCPATSDVMPRVESMQVGTHLRGQQERKGGRGGWEEEEEEEEEEHIQNRTRARHDS